MVSYEKDISIVIPVYNGMPNIVQMLNSINVQTLDKRRLQVTVINDGSTDGTSDYLDSLKLDYVDIIQQANSGSPSGPRNKGIEIANGKYIFFADADDYFASPIALEKMLEHAEEDNLDVGVFKVDASDWNDTYGGLFKKTLRHCSVSNSPIMGSLAPYKLFRTSLLKDNGVRFIEGSAYEDLPFVLECYLLASEIAVYNDLSYYHYAKREDSLSQKKSETTLSFWTAERCIRGIRHYFEIADKYISVDECPGIYERPFACARNSILRAPKGSWPTIRKLLKPYYTDGVRSLMSLSNMVVIDALLKGDSALEEVLASLDKIGHVPPLRFKKQLLGSGYRYSTGRNSYPIPGNIAGLKKIRLNKPRIIRNEITEVFWNQGGAHGPVIKGKLQVIRDSEKPHPLSVYIRVTHVNDCLIFPVDVSDASSGLAYEGVYVHDLVWSIALDFDEIEFSTCLGSRIYSIHLDCYLGKQKFSSKVGKFSTENVKANWASGAVLLDSGAYFNPVISIGGNFEFRYLPGDVCK